MKATERPLPLLIGGCNGAGRSTPARKLLPEFGIVRFLNADEIARGLSPFDSAAAALGAGRLLLNEARKLIASESSLALESTLSGRGHAGSLRRAKAAGFRIVLHYVMIESPGQVIERVRLRARLGGHNVPDGDVARRFVRGRRLLLDLCLPLADEWGVWGNDLPPTRRIAGDEDCDLNQLREMLEPSKIEETTEPRLSIHSQRVVKAGRDATEEILENYRHLVMCTNRLRSYSPGDAFVVGEADADLRFAHGSPPWGVRVRRGNSRSRLIAASSVCPRLFRPSSPRTPRGLDPPWNRRRSRRADIVPGAALPDVQTPARLISS